MAFKTIKIKNIEGSQLVEIPENFRINDDKVYLKKVGNSIYVIPFHDPWQNLFESVNEFTEDYMSVRNEPVQQKRESFD